MDPRILQIANAYSFAGVLLGLPALAGTVFFGFSALSMSALRRQGEKSTPYPKNADAIVLTIVTMAKAIGGAAHLLGKIGSGIMFGLAAASIGVLLFASLLYGTGRGLVRHEDWARWTGIVLMLPVFAASILRFLSRGGGPVRLIALALAASAGYAGYILWTAFGDHA